MPHLKRLLAAELNKEVVEKVLENIRDICEEMGPDGIVDDLEWIVGVIEELLDKTSVCQTGGDDDEKPEGESDEDSDADDEDLDHDELILGNATDLIVGLSKCLGDSFLP